MNRPSRYGSWRADDRCAVRAGLAAVRPVCAGGVRGGLQPAARHVATVGRFGRKPDSTFRHLILTGDGLPRKRTGIPDSTASTASGTCSASVPTTGTVGPHLYGDAMAARTKSAKDRPSYRCTECGWTTAKWLGRCPECQAWGTVEEFGGAPAVRTTAAGRVSTAAVPIGQVDSRQATARSTGVGELDRVLGGGLVPGAVVLLAGEPGVGKSTLLLDVAAKAGERRPPHAVRHRRGVRQPGADARRPDRGDQRPPLSGGRDRPLRRAGAPGRGQAVPARPRLRADRRLTGDRRARPAAWRRSARSPAR